MSLSLLEAITYVDRIHVSFYIENGTEYAAELNAWCIYLCYDAESVHSTANSCFSNCTRKRMMLNTHRNIQLFL